VYRRGITQDWLTTNVVFRMLTSGACNREDQEAAYRGVFDHAPEPSHARLFKDGSAEDPRVLGDAQFITDVLRVTGRRSPDRTRRARHLEGDIPGVVMRVIEQFNALCDERLSRRQAGTWRRRVTYENVRSGSRKRPLPMVRALAVSCLVEHEVATRTQAARFFGRGANSVSAGRGRFYEALFRVWFGAMPEILFGPGRDGDRSVGTRNENHERNEDRERTIASAL
jgi:hypothetical protein